MTDLRLWHQSLTDLGLLDAYQRGLTEHLTDVVTDDVVVDVHGMSSGTYTTPYPGSRIHQVYLQSLHKEQFVSAALTAESAGYDGMIIATIPDLALEECRSLVDIPVVGFGEASFKVASMLGGVIGVVSFDIEPLEPQLRRNAERYGVGSLLGPMTDAKASFDDVVDGLAGGDAGKVVRAVTEAGRELIARGAQVIVPGPGPMNLLVARQRLTRIDDVPVIDSLRASAEMCAMLARMRRAGVYPSRRGFYWAKPERAQVAAAREVYGLATPR
ncbi:MAG: hydantoin racemase [Streptosporangiales bacterium]|nr:hydantoin racemase [Streptosporangiales bacterium]